MSYSHSREANFWLFAIFGPFQIHPTYIVTFPLYPLFDFYLPLSLRTINLMFVEINGKHKIIIKTYRF